MNPSSGSTSADEPRETSRSPGRWSLVILGVLVLVPLAAWRLTQSRTGALESPDVSMKGLPPAVARQLAPLKDATRESPKSDEVWGKLGMAFARHGAHGQARICFEHAWRLAPDKFQWPYLLGNSLSMIDPPAALARLEEAIAIDPTIDIAHIKAAELMLELDRLDEAETHLTRARKGSPNDLHGLLAAARLHLARAEPEAAMPFATKAVAIGVGYRATHEVLAQVHQRRGDRSAAEHALQVASELPDERVPYNDPYVDEVRSLDDKGQQLRRRARRLVTEQKYGEAIELLGKAWEDNPKDSRLPVELARVMAQINQPAAAAAVLDQALVRNPASATVRVQRGVLYFLQQDFDNAANAFEAAIQRKPDYALAYFYLGQSRWKQGEFEKAIEALEQSVALQPSHRDAHKGLGVLLLKQNRPREALRHLSVASRLDPDDREVQTLLKQAVESTEKNKH